MVDVLLLVDALYEHAESAGTAMDISGCAGDNTRLIECLAGKSKASESCSVAGFGRNFLKDAGSVTQALEAYLPGPGAAPPAADTGPSWRSLEAFLRPVDCGEDLAKHRNAFVAGTREWIFPEIEAWISQSRERVFWIKGSGGMGKSVISAQCIARYSTGPERPAGVDAASSLHVAAYFLCKHDSAERNEPRRVIATLAFRLAASRP
jgi:hypothetical protein